MKIPLRELTAHYNIMDIFMVEKCQSSTSKIIKLKLFWIFSEKVSDKNQQKSDISVLTAKLPFE